MTLATASENKEIYGQLHDNIIDKRLNAVEPIRRYAHHSQYGIFLELIPPGSQVLDAGCGDGVLSVMLAEHGCIVTGIDISHPNIAIAKKYAAEQGVADRTTFLVGDTEHLPVDDKAFDYVVCSHVLEHVPDFEQGARELARIARKQVFVAIPTCLTLGGMALLGGDKYWRISRRSLYALPYGFLRVIFALVTGSEGVNEGYEGHMELIHIWRFPWRGKNRIEGGNLRVVKYGASAYVVPYFSIFIPLCKALHRFRWMPIIRNFGHGTTYVCEPVKA